MEETKERYCVTGATGYIGSWLVKSLLQRGYWVHATVRDPAKSLHLLTLCGGNDRLRLFKADMHEEGSFDEAVKGCKGVFHVAASMQFGVEEKENTGYVQSNIIDPAIKGTLNLMKACSKTKSVKRVVFTSSISTLTAKDSAGRWRPVVDESCHTPIDHVWNMKASGWVYVLSKILTEEAAFEFANEKGIDFVSVITTTVGGPFLTSTVPSSIRVLLSPVTDICSAHIFLMEHNEARGQYICCSHSCSMSELVCYLAKECPFSEIKRPLKEAHGSVFSEISSKKLRDLGFTYKCSLQDIIHHSVNCCVDHGFLPPIQK